MKNIFERLNELFCELYLHSFYDRDNMDDNMDDNMPDNRKEVSYEILQFVEVRLPVDNFHYMVPSVNIDSSELLLMIYSAL